MEVTVTELTHANEITASMVRLARRIDPGARLPYVGYGGYGIVYWIAKPAFVACGLPVREKGTLEVAIHSCDGDCLCGDCANDVELWGTDAVLCPELGDVYGDTGIRCDHCGEWIVEPFEDEDEDEDEEAPHILASLPVPQITVRR